ARPLRRATHERGGRQPPGASPSGARGSRQLRSELAAQVAQVGLRVDATPGHALDRLLRRELRTEHVQMLVKPLAEVAERAALEPLVEVAEILERALPDLHGDDVA